MKDCIYCLAVDCEWNDNEYCLLKHGIEITKDGRCCYYEKVSLYQDMLEG